MTHVITLTGYSGVGKDTVAKLLELKYGYHRMALGDRLRQLVTTIDPVVDTDENGEDIHLRRAVPVLGWDGTKRMYPEVRKILQYLGEGAREVLGQRVWIDPILKTIGNWECVVISDLRSQSDLDFLRAGGFSSVVAVHLKREGVGPVNAHSSEDVDLKTDVMQVISSIGLEGMPKVVDNMMSHVRKMQKDQFNGRYLTVTGNSDDRFARLKARYPGP